MPEELNIKDELYQLGLTEWEKNALLQIINNGNYKGTDIDLVVNLKNTIHQAITILNVTELGTGVISFTIDGGGHINNPGGRGGGGRDGNNNRGAGGSAGIPGGKGGDGGPLGVSGGATAFGNGGVAGPTSGEANLGGGGGGGASSVAGGNGASGLVLVMY